MTAEPGAFYAVLVLCGLLVIAAIALLVDEVIDMCEGEEE